ncbi:MAG: DUF1360 domain-containing protein [Egibacteraceae bacterium]
MRQELHDAPDIHVCAILPETVATPIFRHAANDTGRAVAPLPPVVKPQRVARTILRCVKHPKAEITVRQVGRLWVWLNAVLPRLYDWAVPYVMDRCGFRNEAAEPVPGNLFEPMPKSKPSSWRVAMETSRSHVVSEGQREGRGRLAQAMSGAAASIAAQKAEYTQGEDRPLGAFAALIATYVATVTALSALVRRSDRELPERFKAADLALMAIATHKLSRLIAKDPITSPIRAPFTRLAGQSAPAELHEEVRGTGARKALGELVSCPFCVSQWTATGFSFGLVVAPRATRWVMSVFAAVTGADFLQYAYALAQQRTQS